MNDVSRITALIGKNVQNSVSDDLYNMIHRLCVRNNFNYSHKKINMNFIEYIEFFRKGKFNEYTGLSITQPYKIDILNKLSKVDKTAKKIGAVNTVIISKNHTKGFNTDWYGIYNIIKMNKYKKKGFVCIFGSGGAARAAIYAVKKLHLNFCLLYKETIPIENGTDLLLKNRKISKKMFTYKKVVEKVSKANIIINATSAGTLGQQPFPFEIDRIEHLDMKEKLFIDVVYFPLMTPLLTFFQKKKATVFNGLWMMIFQGLKAYSMWNNIKININHINVVDIYKKLEAKLNENKINDKS